MLFTLTMVLRSITTLFTTCGPPQPPHHGTPMKPGCPHHGMSGSPHPSAHQPSAGPTLTPIERPGTPNQATSAGAETGATTTGPGAQAQKPPTKTQRP